MRAPDLPIEVDVDGIRVTFELVDAGGGDTKQIEATVHADVSPDVALALASEAILRIGGTVMWQREPVGPGRN